MKWRNAVVLSFGITSKNHTLQMEAVSDGCVFKEASTTLFERIVTNRRLWPYYLMLLPGVAYFIIFRYIPITNLIMVFKDFRLAKGIWASNWNGIANFIELFNAYYFKTVFRP